MRFLLRYVMGYMWLRDKYSKLLQREELRHQVGIRNEQKDFSTNAE